MVESCLSLDCFLKSFLIASTLLTYIAVIFPFVILSKLVVLFCRLVKVRKILLGHLVYLYQEPSVVPLSLKSTFTAHKQIAFMISSFPI